MTANFRNLKYYIAGKVERNQNFVRLSSRSQSIKPVEKSYRFSIYSPLWTSQLITMYDEIKNTSMRKFEHDYDVFYGYKCYRTQITLEKVGF